MVYARDTEARELTFGVSGYLLRDALVMFDHQSESLWAQFMGQAISGPHAGDRLVLLPSRITTWTRWRAEQPGGTVMDKGSLSTYPGSSFAFDAEAAEAVGVQTDEGLSSHDLVLGVVAGGAHAAFAMKTLSTAGVLNVEIGGVPVVVTATDGLYSGAAFERTTGNDTLAFEPAGVGMLTDTATGSSWDAQTGTAVSGPRTGTTLARVDARHSFWFAWKAYYPATELR